jgi:hypothetical protein
MTNSKQAYSAGSLTKGAPTSDEIRALLAHWRSGESTAAFAQRARQQGWITKPTAQRTDDIIRLFTAWLLTPDNTPARCLKQVMQLPGEQRPLPELIFLYKARRESVLNDFTRTVFWPMQQDGFLYLQTADIEAFLRDAQAQGLAAKGWSSQTRTRLAQGIMKALLDAGFLHSATPYRREFIPYHAPDFLIAYLAYDLRRQDLSNGRLVEHPDWQLFGLNRSRVLGRLSELDQRAGLIVQHAGSVVSITWLHGSMEELIAAYAH